MWCLNEKHIVFVCDDSGSMNTRENGHSRWDELKQTVNMVFDIASVYDPVGMDIHFLNRPTFFGVKDINIVSKCFQSNPSGCTPLITKLNEIKENYKNTNRDMCSALFEIICENGLYWLCQIIFANQFTEGISFGEANINGHF